MLEFDLVPGEYRAALRTQRWLRATGLALAVVVGITVVARVGLALASTRLQQTITQTEQQIQSAVAARKAVDQLKTQVNNLRSETTFADALTTGPDPVAVLRALDSALNDKLWLDRIEILRTRDKASDGSTPPHGLALASLTHKKVHWRLGGTVKFIGHGISHGAVSAFIASLESSGVVARVELNKSRVRSEHGVDIIDFELTAQIPLTEAAP